jgi:hypothetical protein
LRHRDSQNSFLVLLRICAPDLCDLHVFLENELPPYAREFPDFEFALESGYTYFGELSDKVGNHARRITRCISNCAKGTSITVPGEHTVSVATRRNSSLASDFSFYTVEIRINSLPQRTDYVVTVKFRKLAENGFSLAHTDLRCPPGEWWLSENLPQIADVKLVDNGPPKSIMLFQLSANFYLPVLIGIRDREVWYYIDSESNYERFWPKWKTWRSVKKYPRLSYQEHIQSPQSVGALHLGCHHYGRCDEEWKEGIGSGYDIHIKVTPAWVISRVSRGPIDFRAMTITITERQT